MTDNKIKTSVNVSIRLGNYKDKTKKELEKISREFNEEQERLVNVHALGDTQKQDEPNDV